MISELAARLKQSPEDGKGWAMLARTYAVTKRYPEAVEAYEEASKLIPDDAVMLVDYADILAMENGKKFKGKPLELLRRALKADPNNVKGLALMGSALFQAGDYPAAVAHWSKLLPMLPPDAPLTAQVKAGIENAHKLANGAQSVPDGQAQPANVTKVSGVVELSPSLRSKVAPTDTVFVFAKAVSGPPMPIAVIRAQASELPLKFVLDDSMSMMPSMKLSGQQQVTVSAKISKSGSATQQSGDMKGEVSPVKVGANNIRIVIDSVVP